jgi:hypothetical protein
MLDRVAPPRIYPAGSLGTRGLQHIERRTVRGRRCSMRIERSMAFAFDTLVQAKRLREAGFDENQAEALTTVLRDAVKPFDTSELATKADLAALSVATKADISGLKDDLAALSVAIKADISRLKDDLAALSIATKADIAALNADLAALKADVATKADLAALKADIATKADLAALKADVATKADLAVLKAEVATKSELSALKADIKADLAALKADLLQWVIGLVLGAVVLNAFVVIGSIFGLLKLLGR